MMSDGDTTIPHPVRSDGRHAAFADASAPRHEAEDATAATVDALLTTAGPTIAPAPAPATAASKTDDTGPLDTGQTFGPRYHIIRLLGVGGMGAVYHAWDAELGVSVAIKVIRPEIMADPETGAEVERRFKRELLLARQVTHKNVVRIHDLGEIDGIKYITMSYVEGTDLATRLKAEGPLPVPDVLRIARSVVSGLVAAHAAGVVHRDLKPANIMIGTDGEALIMDFGIARSSGQAAHTNQTTVVAALPASLRAAATAAAATAVGAVTGTVAYMAPEQARGEDVDQRADVYAFGLILYDLVLGRRRGKAAGALAELQARMKEAPPSARSLLPEIPEAFDAVINRCIDPDPAKRFQTTTELEAALDLLDERGEPIPIRRVVGIKLMAAVIALAAVGLGGSWYYASTLAPPEEHEPVRVVIADLANQTGDAAFDGTLEPMLRRVLEGDSSFISAYDRNGVIRTLGVSLTAALDERSAQTLAVNQGLDVVVSGSVTRQGSGYRISIKAVRTVTGEVIAEENARASTRDAVLGVATDLVSDVREALGDESDSAPMFARINLSATSLDVLRLYAAAQDAMSKGQFEQAIQHASMAVDLDPLFGIGYQLLSVASSNMGRPQDAERYIKEAVERTDGMTDREKLTTRGMFARVTGDYPQCVKEYGDLITRYAADVVGHNQLALCSSMLRDMPRALDEMQQVVTLLPNRTLFRDNLALYANYASDFDRAEKEALAIEDPDVFSVLALAFAQAGKGQIAEARKTYERMSAMNALGQSLAASGLADLSILEGRYAEAIQQLTPAVAADLESQNHDRAAAKLALLASAQLLRGQKAAAVASAERALSLSQVVKIRFLAARTFIEAEAVQKARPLITSLGNELQTEPQAYAKILEGGIALNSGDARAAIKLLTEANGMLDTWIGNFDLGRAYEDAKAYIQAESQFDRCLKRRGEAISLFLDQEPTLSVLPPVYYHQGRVREASNKAAFGESYRSYLVLRGDSTDDVVARELRRSTAK
jgi:tRNA A-37 threonylcarbamoyl transferase component Bud32